MPGKLFALILFFFLQGDFAFGQGDSSVTAPVQRKKVYFNSQTWAQRQQVKDSLKRVADSLKVISDSISLTWIKAPDPHRPNQFVDSLIAVNLVKNLNFQDWAKKFKKKVNRYQPGTPRYKGERWVLFCVLCLVLLFAVLRYSFSKELGVIVQSFYSNRILSHISKEDRLFSSWPFVFLYLLLGFTIGMFLYLSGRFYQLNYVFDGFEWFLTLSAVIVGLFTLKIILLRILGFLFGIQRLVKEYISILYLSYFNAAMLFLPLVVAYSLTTAAYAMIYNYVASALLLIIFVFQFLRAGANILQNFRFPITYLFIYLCALEICPVLILLKALRF